MRRRSGRSLLQTAATPGTRETAATSIEEWQRMLERRGPGAPITGAVAEEFGDRLRAGANGDARPGR